MPASVPNTFVDGQTATAEGVNQNFSALVTYLNGLSIPSTPVTIANGGTGAATVQGALTALGLGAGTFIPCTVAVSGSGPYVVTATTLTTAATVSAYSTGLALLFRMPNTAYSGSAIQIAYEASGSSALTAVPLYDAGGINAITATQANQVILAVYNSALSGFCLFNTPPNAFNTARFAAFNGNASAQSWTCPAGVTTAYITACGGGGSGGGSASATVSGGGGGGAGDSIVRQAITVSPGSVYTINVAVGVTGSAGANGTAGNGTTFALSGTNLISLGGGGGGTAGTNTSPASGGTRGGLGGSNGREGFYVSASSFSVGGAGGDCFLGKGGTPAFDGQNGQYGQAYGSGGAGASGNSAAATSGGGTEGGYLLIEW